MNEQALTHCPNWCKTGWQIIFTLHNAKQNSNSPICICCYELTAVADHQQISPLESQYHHTSHVTTPEQIDKQQHHEPRQVNSQWLQGHCCNKVTMVSCKFCAVLEKSMGMPKHKSDYLC